MASSMISSSSEGKKNMKMPKTRVISKWDELYLPFNLLPIDSWDFRFFFPEAPETISVRVSSDFSSGIFSLRMGDLDL
jgi:hypothetical protein